MDFVQNTKLAVEKEGELNCSLKSLFDLKSNEPISVVKGDEEYINRVINNPLSFNNFTRLSEFIKFVGVTDNFKEIVDYFETPNNHTPAGFKINYIIEERNVLKVDLVRDISYDQDG